jgi:membrane protease YdiL (CAAX protease family)
MMSDSGDSLVEVYRAGNFLQAHALRNALEAQGIRAIIDNESLQGALGEVPFGWSSAPKLLVAEKDEATARKLIRDLVQLPGKKSLDDNDCLACGAPMQGAATCTNCGWSFTDESPAEKSDIPVNTGAEQKTPIEASGTNHGSRVWFELAVIASITFVPTTIYAVINRLEPAGPLAGWLNLISVTASSIGPILVTLYVIVHSGLSMSSFGLKRPGFADLLAGLVLSMFMIMIWGVFDSYRDYEQTSPDQAALQTFTIFSGFCTVMTYCIYALPEELVYRSYLINRFSSQLRSRVPAVLISAIVYAAVGFGRDSIYGLQCFSLGILFGTLYVVWPRFWTFAIANALVNIAYEFRSAAIG